MTESQWVNVLIVTLIVIPVFSWTSAAILTWLAIQKPYITSLIERTFSAACKAIGSTIVAFVAINSVTHLVMLPRPWGIGLLAIGLVFLEIPSVVWLLLYWIRRFRGHDDVA